MSAPIDWSKPLESRHGEALRLKILTESPNPDALGDYYLVREDGEDPIDALIDTLIVRSDGSRWGCPRDILVVRNRAEEWGRDISVDGTKPAWLGVADRFQWIGKGLVWSDWLTGCKYVEGRDWTRADGTTAIRLPADHFAYRALDAGFEPWGGGVAAPADWDGGDVLYADGIPGGGPYSWSHEFRGGLNVIGYRKRVEESLAGFDAASPFITDAGISIGFTPIDHDEIVFRAQIAVIRAQAALLVAEADRAEAEVAA